MRAQRKISHISFLIFISFFFFRYTVLGSRYAESERVREKINSNNKEKNVKITVNYREEEKCFMTTSAPKASASNAEEMECGAR